MTARIQSAPSGSYIIDLGEDLSEDEDGCANEEVLSANLARPSEPPSKRLREDGEVTEIHDASDERVINITEFAEYQKLVKRIRDRVDTDNAALKDEAERLRKCVNQLKVNMTEREQSMQLKDSTIAEPEESLKLAQEVSDIAAKEQTLQRLKIESFKRTLDQLEEFKKKVKALF
ncbi:hypothetical protein E8E12_006772 [Didymella heteroderae]|uniref:Uncharacterized protein n=1 Tax=Didymella heteroderae TaxID=1769908 RepID=A0A9P4WR47_9PLEO|nr:hypothetical protein E8E12_006772 [Didymella heteroderae]